MRVLGIIGPSGCGKTTILKQLFDEGLIYVNPTYTERPKRDNEEELEHKFVDSEEFDRLEKSGFFVKVIRAFNLKYRYGVPKLKTEDGKISVVMLRASLLPLLFKYYPDSIVYQIEAPVSLARQWIQSRGDDEIGSRLEQFKAEAEAGRKHANRVFINNGDSAICAEKIKSSLELDFK